MIVINSNVVVIFSYKLSLALSILMVLSPFQYFIYSLSQNKIIVENN